MRSRLRPTDVLRRLDGVQWTALAGGRLLVRRAGGVHLVDGVTPEDVEAVLAAVDGHRRAEEIVDALAEHTTTRAAVGLLRRLDGELLGRVPAALDGRVVIVGNGRAGRRLQEILAAIGLGRCERLDAGPAADRLADTDVVIAALEETPYAELTALQSTCLSSGVPSLFVTFDADGTRVGPATEPGETACFACSQLASFAFLDSEDLSRTIGALRTLAWDGAPAPLEAAAAEAWRLLAPGGEPRLLTHVRRFSAAGETSYPVVLSPECPLHCLEFSKHGLEFSKHGLEFSKHGLESAKHATRRGAQAAVEVIEIEESRAAALASEDLVTSIGILGGGTAGYLTALALRRKLPHLRVTLIESSAVPIVGVGEATTPLMPQFLHADLGIDVHELFRDVRPTLKLGIRFLWGPPEEADFSYPFGAVRPLESLVYDGHLRHASLRSMMMSSDRVPVLEPEDDPVSRLDAEVAYHLDNARFVGSLREQARASGVEHVDATIADVETTADGGSVESLVSDDGRRFAFDLYVDCSGFRSILIEKALRSPFQSFGRSLFTDRAWVGTVPVESGGVRPYTQAETFPSGWCWSTPQLGEDHRGYVFCSAFESDDEALEILLERCPNLTRPRLVRFRAGRHEHFWKGNVVALGNAYGFVEPLESTALHMLIRQIGYLLQSFPLRRGVPGPEAILNRRVNRAWDYLSWFLAIHYKFNRNSESPFWQACRGEVDVDLHGELLEAFAARGPLSYDSAARRHFDYPDPLWGPEGIDVILLGQRAESYLPRPRLDRQAWQRHLGSCRRVVQRSLGQEAALRLMTEEPSVLERLAQAYRDVGPAFPVGQGSSGR